MKIVALSVTDFMGLKSVEVRPDPTLVVITGRNESGKTSLLTAIESVICGSKATPTRPVRAGCDRSEVTVDLGDITVTRTFKPDGSDRLTVRNADGSKPAAPQTLLERLFRRITFDPAAVARMDGKELAKTLRSLAGLDEPFARIDAEIKQAEEERTRVNRDVKADEGSLRNFPTEAELAAVPDDETGAADLMEQYRDAVNEQSQNDSIRQDVKTCRNAVARACEDREASGRRVESLRKQLAEAEAEDVRRLEMITRCEADYRDAAALADGLTDPDTAGLHARLGALESANALVRRKRERQTVYDRWVTNRESAVELTSTIESLRVEKQVRLAEARFPVDGLEVVGDEVRWNGTIVEQVSAARKIRLGLAIGAALNPEIKVAIVRDASLLDQAAFDEVREWAVETGFQAFLEVVGSADSREGIVIEAGEVVADRQKPTAIPEWKSDPEKITKGLADWKRPRDGKQAAYDDLLRQAGELF